jgi:hypothetical protein
LALRQERQVRSLARRGRRSPAMASRRERLATPRHQERPVMWQHLEVAAGPGWLPQLVAAVAAAAAFERPHEM